MTHADQRIYFVQLYNLAIRELEANHEATKTMALIKALNSSYNERKLAATSRGNST